MASKPEIGAHQSGKTHHSQAHDRSHGHAPGPKKGGAGGHNWGRPGAELDLAAADVAREMAERSDDDVSLREVAVTLDTIAIESVIEHAVKEYFDSADLNEAGASIQRFRYGKHAHKIVATAVLLSLDRTNAERELCSRLVSRLRDMRIVSAGDMEKAFSEILAQIPDLKLDTPDVCDLVGRFLARAVADDCLAPAYVNEHRALNGDFSALAKDAVEKARTLLVIPFAHTRLDLVWGHNGSIEPLESVVESIKTLVAEYLASADIDEAERCLRELAAPHFHHELVFEAILAVLDTDTAKHASSAIELVVRLLSHTVAAGIVTPNQLETGIARVTDSLDDITVDDPHAPEYLDRLYSLMAADKALAEARALVAPPAGTA